MDRRYFLKTSFAGLLLASYRQLPASQLPGITDREIEEIIVFQKQDGTSIYGQTGWALAKATLRFGSVGYGVGGAVLGSLGAGFVVAGITNPEKISAGAAAGLGASFMGAAVLAESMSVLLGWLANDPPRKDYKVNTCTGSLIENLYVPEKDLPKTRDTLDLMNKATGDIRRVWDRVELYQGARLANDKEWMLKHNQGAAKSYTAFYKHTQTLASQFPMFIDEFLSGKFGDVEKIFEATKKLAGEKLGQTEIYKKYFNSLIFNSACIDNTHGNILSNLSAIPIQQVSKKSLLEVQEHIIQFARKLDQPPKI